MKGATRGIVRSDRVRGEFYLRVVQELLIVRQLFIQKIGTNLPTRELFGVRLVGLVFGR
jgi:hypothetical protein